MILDVYKYSNNFFMVTYILDFWRKIRQPMFFVEPSFPLLQHEEDCGKDKKDINQDQNETYSLLLNETTKGE